LTLSFFYDIPVTSICLPCYQVAYLSCAQWIDFPSVQLFRCQLEPFPVLSYDKLLAKPATLFHFRSVSLLFLPCFCSGVRWFACVASMMLDHVGYTYYHPFLQMYMMSYAFFSVCFQSKLSPFSTDTFCPSSESGLIHCGRNITELPSVSRDGLRWNMLWSELTTTSLPPLVNSSSS